MLSSETTFCCLGMCGGGTFLNMNEIYKLGAHGLNKFGAPVLRQSHLTYALNCQHGYQVWSSKRMFNALAGPPQRTQQAPRGGRPPTDRAPRTTTGDTLNQQNLYEIPHKEKLWVLQSIDDVQFNDRIASRLDNNETTEPRK